MTLEKVIAILSESLDIEASNISPTTTFEDLDADSLDTVEILMTMEEEFGVEINFEEAGKTVGELVAYIDSHREE